MFSTRNQGLRQLILTVSSDLRAQRAIPDGVLGISGVPEPTTEARLRALEGHGVSAQKSPSRVQDKDKGVAGRNRKEICLPVEGSLICPPVKSMFFDQSGPPEI